MARFDSSEKSGALLSAALPRTLEFRLSNNAAGSPLIDPVPWDCPGAKEIGFRIPERYNASEILFQNVTARGERLAVTGPQKRSYAVLAAEAAQWGNALLALGLARGERVLLLLDDTPVYPAAFFGAVRAGLVPILVNVLTPADLLRFYIVDSGAKVAVAEAEFCDRFAQIGRNTGLRTLIAANGQAKARISGVAIKEAWSWLMSHSTQLRAADTHRNDMALWMYSSGSTGKPKGIVHLHHDMAYTHASYGHHVLKLNADDVCFSVAKIFFSYGFGNSITFPFSVGATSLLLPGRATPQSIFAALEQYRPTVFFGVPTLYSRLVNTPEIANADFSSLRLAVSAAEVLSDDTCQAFKAKTGLEIIDCLGATEMLNVYISNTLEQRKSGAAGRRVPGYEIVLKNESGAVVNGAGEGTLWIRGHSAMPLYWNSPQKTTERIQDGGWHCTGDRFCRDSDGFYFFQGRADDLIKISGQWVHPIEVQRCLGEHPSVRECAVLATKLADGRMTLKAFVVLHEAAVDRRRSARMLQDHVKRKLMPFKYPRIVQFMQELPKTGTGKIDRQALLSAARSGEIVINGRNGPREQQVRRPEKASLCDKASAAS